MTISVITPFRGGPFDHLKNQRFAAAEPAREAPRAIRHRRTESAEERRERRAEKDREYRSLLAALPGLMQPRAEFDRRPLTDRETSSGTTTATARAIVAAAELARSGKGHELPPPTGLAAAIIAAGKKRRGEA